MRYETHFAAMPADVIFWHAWDGFVNGSQLYAPRCYVRRDGRVHELREFGGAWTPADAGFEFATPVATYCQPLTAAAAPAAQGLLNSLI